MYTEALSAFLTGILVVAVLIGFSVMVDRFWTNERLVKITFMGAGYLFPGILFLTFLFLIVLEPPTTDDFRLGFISFIHNKLSEFGYTRLYAAFNFSLVGGIGLVYVLSPLVPSAAIDREGHMYAFFVFLAIGLVTLVGIVFFEVIAWILGVVATIIGILVGVKKLSGQ